jgi:hypothetical protein
LSSTVPRSLPTLGCCRQALEKKKLDDEAWGEIETCEGRTPMQTLMDGKPIWKEKFVG